MDPQPSTSQKDVDVFLSPRKKRPRKAFTVTEKVMIRNAYKYVKNETSAQLEAFEVVEENECMSKVADILGITSRSVCNVLKEVNKGAPPTPPKKTGPKRSFKDKIDEFTFSAIRRIVHQFFYRNEPPTIAKACNENQCPAIKERLEQHALSHHSTFRPSVISQEPSLRNSACTEEGCPAIRERFEQHVLSHHTNNRRSVSSQNTEACSGTYSSSDSETPSVAIVNSDAQTSTDNLELEELKSLKIPKKKKGSYRQGVQREILIWAEDLPKYPNPSAENLKQNLINELIEKVDNLKSEVNEEFYDAKLSNEVCKFLDSLPLNPNVKKGIPALESLKLQFIQKIYELNKQTVSSIAKKHRKRSSIRNSVTNTTKVNNNNYLRDNKTSHLNYLRNKQTKTIGTTPQFALEDNSYITFQRPEFQNKNFKDKNHADAQVQHNFYNMPPYYGQIYGQPDLKTKEQLKTKINEDVYKQKISIWLAKVVQKSERNIEQNDMKVLTDILYNRIRLLLTKKLNSPKYKLLLKGEILNFLYDYFMVAVATNGAHFHKLVDNLAITFLIEKTNSGTPYSRSNTKHSYYCTEQRIGYHVDTECYYKPIINKIVADALENVITHSENIENDITDILLYNIEQIRLGFHEEFREDLHVLLKSSTDLYDISITDIINVIMDRLTSIFCDNFDDDESTENVERPPWFNIVSVYKSELELNGPPKFSETYLQRYSNIIKRSEPKLNPEEKAYNKSISALISAWVNTLPKKRNKTEDMIMKETIINNLATDIIDQVKLEAAAPEIWNEKEKYLSFFIHRWLNRFEYFDNINNAKPYVDELIKKLKDIPFPAHGSQIIKKINKFMKMTSCSQATLMPEDILEDEILMIINAQPSKIFIDEDKEIRSQQVHEFTLDIQNILNDSSKDITKEIIKWLKKIVKINEKEKFISLKEQLTERINSFLRERTSHFNNQDRISQENKDAQIKKVTSVCCESIIENTHEPEKIFKEFIAKYIEHYNEVEHLITREVFGEILKIELQKLNARRTKDNDDENQHYVISTPDSLYKELKYVSIISDWLKIFPIHTSFNRIGNKPRVEFINCLAKNLKDIDENRMIYPSETEYKVHLASIINKYADKLPIPTYHKKNISAMVDNLVDVIMKVHPRPCCQIPNCKQNVSSINSTNIPNEQLSNFIEKYICENCEELSKDELKLEAVSARLFKEIDKMRSENSGPSNADEAEEHLASNEPVRRLSLELIYSKEITDCLSNLPLLPLIDNTARNSIVKMICNLAEKMYERWQALYDDPNNTYVNTILSEYVMQWISELPLDTSKEIDESIITLQLLNRMERANKRKFQDWQEVPQTELKHEQSSSELCKLPFKCCDKTNDSYRAQDNSAAIVEAVENWCADLPVQTENENTRMIKGNIATNIFKKVSELNMNPICLTDDILYQELLSEEIEQQLENLPENFKLQATKEELKQQLVSSIMEKKKEIREQASSSEYKQELLNTIELSLPHPVQTYQEESPGFKIYKDRLATMFILENFDHGYDDVKENYTKGIKKEIDKYFQEAQNRNAIPLTKDQIYNDLYSALYNVPLPNYASIAEEVEEIKTRCEIDKWFETLPLRATSSVGEDFVRNQILAMLAKRIYRMEKYEHNAENKIHKEITKWLQKLPLIPDQENKVDEFARILIKRLKSTFGDRKCIPRDESVYINKFVEYKNKAKGKGILGTSQTAGPSRENKAWPCPASPTCCQISPPLSLKPADIIMNIVEMWCQQLPLPVNTNQEKNNTQVLKDNLIIKIIMKISELNVNPETFNNDLLYEALLDDALENLMSTLPTFDESNQSKEIRKDLLKSAIMSVKPLIQKEKAKYEYKQQLHNIVDILLKEPKNLTPEIRALCVSLKTSIIDNFILYNYYRTSKESSFYKMMINFNVEQYFTKVCQNNERLYNPLMVGNHLICELAKVPVPSTLAILEEIREIRIKLEITDFFDEYSLCDRNDKLLLRDQIISTLAKRLCELGKASNTSENFSKMKSIIVKYLKKLEEIVDIEKIDSLVQRLLDLPSTETPLSESKYENIKSLSDNEKRNQILQTPTEDQRFSRYHYGKDNHNSEDGQWMSLLSVTPQDHDPNSTKSNITQLQRNHLSDVQKSQIKGENADNSMNKSKTYYTDFKRGVVLTSSVREEHESNDSPHMKKGIEIRQPINTGQVPKSFTSNLQGHPKLFPELSDQDNTDVQKISMVQSNSVGDSSKAANDQQRFPTSNILNSPKEPTNYQRNTLGQREAVIENQIPSEFLSSTPDNIITKFQNQNLQQPKTPNVSQQVPQQVPQKVKQKVPASAQSNTNNNQSYSFRKGTATQDKNQLPTPSSDLSSLTETSKSSAPFTNTKESSNFSVPSQSSSSTPPLTPRRLISESNAPCCKRRPSILIFNPSDALSESNSSAQFTQTDLKKRRTDLTSDKDNEDKACKCGKRKSLCRSEVPICRAHKKRRCKLCKSLSPFYCKMPPCRYPGFYYY